MSKTVQEIKAFLRGEVFDDDNVLNKYSRDASIFEVRPEAVVSPADAEEVRKLVKFIGDKARKGYPVSLTVRAGGSDMTGGPLSESVVLDVSNLNEIKEVTDDYAVLQPGVFYRDFEKKTLERGRIMPAYPASRELCMVGGMVGNNAGGEKTLKYGKVEGYVLELKAALADGNEYTLKPLSGFELREKMRLQNFEGEIYRKIFELIKDNFEAINAARPKVSKNSAGYFLWNVWDKKRDVFDLTKLFVGSQGTLGIITEIKFRLQPVQENSGMLVIYLQDKKDLLSLPKIVGEVSGFKPSSFESYDEHTLKLAFKFFGDFARVLGKGFLSIALNFLPDFLMILRGGMPKMVLIVEFEEKAQGEVGAKITVLKDRLERLGLKTRPVFTREEAAKYWTIRRESFNLLRKKVKDRKAAPFIDDVIVKPEHLDKFLPALYSILNKYGLFYTVAGHVGDGNFHIIPLVKLEDDGEREKIFKATREVYGLVLKYGGSITAEHNDGILRTPYLESMYGKKMVGIFGQVKDIFDPLNIFNPGKKVRGSLEYAREHVRRK